MAAWTATANHASIIARFSSPKPSSLVPRRGMSGGGDHHGPPRVNIWEDPMSPSKWKEEHFVIASLSGWVLLFYGGYKLFSGGKSKTEEKVGETPDGPIYRGPQITKGYQRIKKKNQGNLGKNENGNDAHGSHGSNNMALTNLTDGRK